MDLEPRASILSTRVDPASPSPRSLARPISWKLPPERIKSSHVTPTGNLLHFHSLLYRGMLVQAIASSFLGLRCFTGGNYVEVSRIIAEIDSQISKLQQARVLLAGAETVKRSGPGRPKGSKNAAASAV